jgi:predicted RNA binding protein YcfA (HicA-like mRNA interferase family)
MLAMPKFPGLSGADIVRALERLGFEMMRQSGSHIIMRRGISGCVVPNHKEVKVGTVNGVLRQAGVTPDEFSEALSK